MPTNITETKCDVRALLGFVMSNGGKEKINFNCYQKAHKYGNDIRDALRDAGVYDKVNVTIGTLTVRIEITDPTLSIDL